MNERIRELAEQAGLKIKYWKTNPPTPMQILADYEQVDKFAELIVQECIEQCNKKDPRPDRYSDWEEFAESRKVRECITSIKEHFGVE